MSDIERPVEHLGDYWGGDPKDLKEHAEFIADNYIHENRPVEILCACIAYDLMTQAAEEIYKLHAKLEFADAGTERLEGLIHTLRDRNGELEKKRERLKQAVELCKKWTDNADGQFEVGENLAYDNVLMWLEDPQSCETAIKNAEDALNLPSSIEDTDA